MKLFAWCAIAALLFFYLPQKFFTSDVKSAIGIAADLAPWRWAWGHLGMLAIHLAALLLALAGAGARALDLWRLRKLDLVERWVFSLGLGVGAVGTFILGLGLLGLLQIKLLLALYVLLGLHGVALLLASRRLLVRRGFVRRNRPRWPIGERLVFAVCVTWCAIFLMADLLAPEAFWDALIYHLGVPKRYLEAGKISHIVPFFSNLPLLQSMNFTLALVLKGEGLARALNLGLGVSLVLAVWRLGCGWLDRGGAWLSTALVATSPMLGLLMIHAGADVATAFFGCLGVLAFVRACPQWPRGAVHGSWLALSGAMAGLAAATKLQGLAVPVVLALLASPLGIRAVVFVAIPAALIFAPWAGRSLIFTGNPFYPLLGQIFPSPFWGTFHQETYGRELVKVWNGLSFGDFSPWPADQNVISRFKRGLIGPVPLLAVLAALAIGVRTAGQRIVLVFTAALAALWVHTVPAYRFYAAGLALLPLLLPLNFKGWVVRAPIWVALFLQLAWYPLVLHKVDQPWRAARGEINRAQFYEEIHTNSSLDAFHLLEDHVPVSRRARVLAVGEVRNYLAPPWSIVPSYFEPTPLLQWASESSNAWRLRVKFKQRGVRYLLVNVPELMRLMRWERMCWGGSIPGNILEKFFSRHTFLGYARGAAWIYEIGDEEEGAVVPECFRLSRDQSALAAFTCATLAQRAQALGDTKRALGYGWAGVAAQPGSGLAWVSLAHSLFVAKRWEQAIGAYQQALHYGWRTSASYRNYGMAFAQLGKFGRARQALEYAQQLDPEAVQIRRDMIAVNEKWFRPSGKGRDRP